MKNNLPYFLIILLLFTFSSYRLRAQNDFKSLELNVSGIPLFDFEEGYFGVVANSGVRYALNDNVAIGTSLFYYSVNDIFVRGVNANVRAYGVAPTVRYTWLKTTVMRFFAEAGIGFGSVLYKSKDKNLDNPFFPVERNNGGLLAYSFAIGARYEISEKIGLEITLPYLKAKNITNNDIDDDLYNGLGLTFGVIFKLR